MRPRLLLALGALLGVTLLLSWHTDQRADAQPAPSVQASGKPVLAQRPTDPALPGIVFVGAPIFDEKTDGGPGVYQGSYHWRDGYIYPRSATYHRAERTMGPPRPGRNLYALVPARPDGKLTRLTHLKSGAVFRPEPSYDGTKVLFALRRDGEDWFHLCEINVDGSGLRQLTDGPFNDFAGTYLPDGRIVFCSDRTGYLEEYHEERTETLFIMNGDGTGIRQITFAPGTYFEPSVLRDGRILFSFWDAFHIDVPPFDKHETYLMTVNPDGTEERHLFGAGQYRFFNRERHSGVGLTQAHEMPDGRILCQSELGPSLIDLRAGLSVRDALAPVFPGTTSVQLGGTTHRVHLSPLGTRSTPYPLQDGRFLYSATPPGARDSGIYVCDPDTRREQLVLNIPNFAEFDAVPVLVERPRPAILPARSPGDGGKRSAPVINLNQATAAELQQLPGIGRRMAERIIAERAKAPFRSVDDLRRVTGIGPRALARLRPHVTVQADSESTDRVGGNTRFLVVAGRDTDHPQRAQALKRARFFRVLEAEYSGVTTSSHTNLETRILGVVPILPDGSAYFEAPADTPLFLDPLDAAGNRVLMNWPYANTSVAAGLPYPTTQMAYMVGRAGETKGCYGCHAPQTRAVPNGALLALRYGPVKVERKSTDLEYRRNEPEAYRTQARLGEAARYRPWLESKDPVRRARACGLFGLLEDGTAPRELLLRPPDGGPCVRMIEDADIQTIARLLKDEAVEVRRAAALALTRLATIREEDALRQALHDQDWQVRFAVTAALEALGKQPDGAEFRAPPDGLRFESLGRQGPSPDNLRMVRAELAKPQPELLAIRAAGKLRDAEAVKLLVPWLRKHEWEYHAAEAAVALGRIGTPEAIAALWQAVRTEVPLRQVHISRYLQHGPRPEEYALLKGLILAGAKPDLKDVHLLVALLPNTFMEKPRYEDRMRPETQRVLMPRLLFERAGLRHRAVEILVAALRGEQKKDDALYDPLLKGINLERPFSEHGRPFDVVKQIGTEEALWLLTCLIDTRADLPSASKRDELERIVVPFLMSANHRERIDAAVLLGITGFGPKAAEVLAAEIAKPYPFPEIASMGKGMPDSNFRDKAYFVQTLARHVEDVSRLRPFVDPRTMTRDVRYGLTHGLAFRGKADGLPLLAEMATSDPITLVRQQARYAVADIQDACRLAGQAVPKVSWPEPEPLEALHPPRALTWSDTSFVEFRDVMPPPEDTADLARYLNDCLGSSHFRNLNNAQAAGAQHLMTDQVEETRLAFARLARLPGEAGRKPLLAALDTPYPYAHYLALQALIERREPEAIPTLIGKLPAFVKAQDTVGFWWCCEALARLKAKDAVPTLARYATAVNPSGTFGPEGMATGYVAAQALARIAADPKQADVAQLLANDNVWLRAGALRGLAEAEVPGVEPLLEEAAAEESPALVRSEARVQLARLQRKKASRGR
jgi:competence ComEA-like helix-hairpin-helix protein